MPRAIPVPIRQQVWHRLQLGQPTRQIAAALRLPPRTVRALARRFRAGGPAALAPGYRRPGHLAHEQPPAAIAAVCQLRREHPTWGAGLILVILRERRPEHAWPSERTAQRWLHRAGLAPAPRGRRPGSNLERATQPHEVWQMDAAECIPLAGGEQVCWLRLVDEFTGAALRTTLFPPAAVEPGGRAAGPGRTPRGLRPVGLAGPHPRG